MLVFFHTINYYHVNIFTGFLELIKDFIYNIITLFIFFFGLTLHRYLFILGALFLFFTGAASSYYLFFFGISPSLAIMPSIFGTNQAEALELVSLKLVFWCSFNIALCIYFTWRYMPRTPTSVLTKLLSLLCLILALSNVAFPKYSFFRSYFPIQYLHNAYFFLFEQNENFYKEDISVKHDFKDSSDDDIIGVLVIGESARYSNFGINGYERNTTPNLEKIDDLINYKAISCSSNTFLSVPCMLSRYGEKELSKINKETSVLSILTRLNFDTLWMGTQSITKYYRNKPGGSFYDEVNFHIIPGGSLIFSPNDLDGKMLPYLHKKIQEIEGKKFIVIHTTGSHWKYASRYTKEFDKFKPSIDPNAKIDPASCSKLELVNSYDNSILYTDYFLSEVIKQLQNSNAFMLYVSDHGESLGEEGRLTHAAEGYFKEQREVPIIIWFSDKYKQKNSEKIEAAKLIAQKTISHDYVFHTILDCLNIESDIIDKSLSLCRRESNL